MPPLSDRLCSRRTLKTLAASVDATKLPYLEKVADDYLYSLFRPYQYDSASIEILLAYLLQKQREATDIRLTMAGKLTSGRS